MKINFSFKNNFQSLKKKNSLSKKLSNKFEKYFNEIEEDIKNPKKTLNVLNKNLKLNFKVNEIKKFNKFQTIIVIGMGGSILGTEAIFHFLKKQVKKKIYFMDDLDEQKLFDTKKKINVKKSLFLIISKSGNTVETLSNVMALNIIKKNSKNVIIISEKNNTLYSIARQNNLFFTEHKKYIGGRYSIFSEVGLIPTFLMGLNINKLRSNSLSFLGGQNKVFLKESSTQLSNIIKSKKFNNLVFLNYAPELEKFLYWCQQLIAESLGKEKKGFFPVISNAPKDHHSLLQLYLDGPKDKIFHIFSLKRKSNIKKRLKNYSHQTHFLNNKNLNSIKNAQKDALIKVLKEKKIPFREFTVNKQDEKVLGELFSYFILETAMIGKFLKVNPFNQPAVEKVKIYTRKFLS